MMAEPSSFYPDVLIETAGCPEPLIDRAVVRSAIEYSERTLCFKANAVTRTTTVNVTDYPLTVTFEQVRIIKVMDVFHGQDRLFPMSEDDIQRVGIFSAMQAEQTGMPRSYFRKADDILTVYPKPRIPSDTATLTVRLALAPLVDAKVIDDMFVQQHYDGVLRGALSRLLSIPGKPWTNPAQAKMHEMEFIRLANREKNNQALGNVRSDRQVRFVKV